MNIENIVLVGLNHMTAPMSCRERVAVPKERLGAALREVMALAGLDEAVLLSTCSRIEIVAAARNPSVSAVSLGNWLRARGGADAGGGLYVKTGLEAVKHLFRVTAGLDSWIVGESEIQGQVRRAYQAAFEARCTGRVLNRVFQSALSAGKAVRAGTGIQTGINSIGGAAALQAHRLFPGGKDGRVVVFGSGEAAEAVVRHLAAKSFTEIWVANRTLEKARALAEPLGGRPVGFEEGLAMLATAKAAVFSVGCERPVLSAAALAPLLAGRAEPLLLIDLGMPRNIEPACGELPGACLRGLDDLKELVRESMERKAADKEKAELLSALAAADCAIELLKGEPAMKTVNIAAALIAAVLFCAAPARAQTDKTEKPAAKVELAQPAGHVGAAACLTCHEGHAGFNKTLHGRKVLSNPKLSNSCESCHGPGAAHAETGDADKIVSPKKLDSAEQSKMCFQCHTNKNLTLWKTSHHNMGGVSCLQCHSVHEGDGRKSLKKPGVFAEKSQTEACLQCHKKQKSDMRLASHHPIPEGKMTCVSCHNPHGGVDGNLKADSSQELCAKCHTEKAGPYANEHPPVTDSCLNCHKPHGSANDKLLKQAMPYLCMNCHKFPHTATANGFTGVSLSREEQRGNCIDCHKEIHGSDRKGSFKD